MTETWLNLARLFQGVEVGSVADWFAGVATLIAVIVALRGYKFAEWQRQQTLKEDRRKHVHMLGSKIAEMANDAFSIADHFKRCLENSIDGAAILPRVFPLIGSSAPDRLLLTLDENAVLIETSNSDYMMTYTEAVRAQIVIHQTMEEYRVRYDALRAAMPVPKDVVGIAHTYELTDEQMRSLLPSANLLNDVLANVAEIINAQNIRCAKLCSQYHSIFKASFPGEQFIAVQMPEAPVIPGLARQKTWKDLKR